MPSPEYVIRHIYGAWRLARLDPAGMGYFDNSIGGFWRSFFAAIVVAPFYAVMVIPSFAQAIEGGADMGLLVVIELIAYALGWAVFPLAMILLARMLSLEAAYVPYIIAYNWSAVIQVGVFLSLTLLDKIAVVPEGLSALLVMIAVLAILFYLWFIARVALGTTALTAAGIVAFEQVISYLIARGTDAFV